MLGHAGYAPGMTDSIRRPVVVAVIGALAVTLYAVWASLQILVLNPLAVAPGRTLGEIHTEMAAMNEQIGIAGVLIFLGIGVAVAVAVAVVSVRRSASPRGTAAVFLAILILGTPAYFVASFGPGMALADAFATSGADRFPGAVPLYIVSLLATGAIIPLVLSRRPAQAVAAA